MAKPTSVRLADVLRIVLERLADEQSKAAFECAALDHALANTGQHSSAETWQRVDDAVQRGRW